jgi:UDP-GlcNAc:undecaprenyl-phosphate GlcNAc-1-phosphate transferase
VTSGNYLVIFACALILGVSVTPVMRRIALHFGALDYPGPRKVHAAPVPLLGGAAIYAAVVSALLLYSDRREIVQAVHILLGATWLSLGGFWDDRKHLPVTAKLLMQAGAVLFLIAGGLQVRLPLPAWINLVLTFWWVIGITNAFNLLDSTDGLCAGVCAVAAACFLLLASLNGQYLVGAYAAALLGACGGFLVYNFDPARIFMGDAGSLFLGFLMAVLGLELRFPTHVPWVTWMVPVLVLGVPIFDTTLVCFSRLRSGKNPLTTPGTDHVSHRLQRLGLSRRATVLLLYAVSGLLGGLALLVSVVTAWIAYTVAIGVGLMAAVILAWLEFWRPGELADAADRMPY